MALQHLRSSTADKRPAPASMSDGQLAINTNLASPGLFFKDSNGDLVKVGPVHVGTTAPNATPASGGQAGNSKGEQWLDTSGTNPVFKIWDGSAWQSEAGEFVNASGDTMTGALVMDNQQQIRFRETTANGTNFIALQAPASVASDKTITLPDVTGTVVTTGDTGSVTSTMLLDGTILNADVNASAAIAGTKISPDFGSQNVVTTGTATAASLNPTGSSVPTNGLYLPAANNVAISTNGTGRLTVGTTAVSSTLAVDHPLGAVGTPSITFTGDLNTGFWSPTADTLAASTNGAERLRITSTGLVGIGTTSPGDQLHVMETNASAAAAPGVSVAQFERAGNAGITVSTADSGQASLFFGDTASSTIGRVQYEHSADDLAFWANNAERARIDSSGRLLIGTSTSVQVPLSSSTLGNPGSQLASTGQGGATSAQYAYSTTAVVAPNLVLARSRGALNTQGLVSNNDTLGRIVFEGSDGQTVGANSGFIRAAVIAAEVDGTPDNADMPGRLVFSTTADGASSPTERMRISNNGTVLMQKTAAGIANEGLEFIWGLGLGVTNNQNPVLRLNRLGTDGTVVSIQQDSVEEGTISVSGTTVSYNGAHLSRWSQLPGGAEREEILRGTVLSNIDEMCTWGEEDNEQLNRMKVSDVEGDPNVSGVFQAWDDDDDTYADDFYCAMTGDFIIRIADGVTVQRGDLLMSAGDGTAKPQGDDIIRSKTIAKVTSTHVTCTYDDGSYCVPCVLMAC